LDGATLSDAMQRRPHIFSSEYINIVRAGELGGTISDILGDLADLLERRAEVRAKIQSALTYPALLICLSFVSVGIVVGGLVPSIAPLFGEGGHGMPAAMSVIMTLVSYGPQFALTFVVLAVVSFLTVLMALRRPANRLAFNRLLLKLPLCGQFLLKQETARFSRTLGTLLHAGVPLLAATTSAQGVIKNHFIKTGVERATNAIREGSTLHRALEKEAILPDEAISLISIGEEAGKLDRMLIRLAEMLERQTQHNLDRFMSLLTPTLTIVIAMVIGGIIMIVISAILGINEMALK
jgi:general secretion pathway protein F